MEPGAALIFFLIGGVVTLVVVASAVLLGIKAASGIIENAVFNALEASKHRPLEGHVDIPTATLEGGPADAVQPVGYGANLRHEKR